jgi:hypothetical protein
MAHAAVLLRDDGRGCTKRHGDKDPRCVARLSASAYAQVVAVALLDCTAPDREETRAAARRYFTKVGAVNGPAAPLPAVPVPPRCP